MLTNMVAWLWALLVVDPFANAVAERLSAARAPQALVASMQACTREAGPLLAERALNDPWWAIITMVGAAIGQTEPASVLAAASPGCATALREARPLLSGTAT